MINHVYMSKRPAGYRYPHVTTEAKESDHRFCPVLEAVRQRVADGREPWGYPHVMPPVKSLAEAQDAKNGLYRARNHTSRKRGRCGDQALSVRADYHDNGDGTYTITFQVWDRATAKQEIIRRVRDGEQLAYNVRR